MEGYTIKQDNDHKHRTRVILEFTAYSDWTSQSPDLSVIENVVQGLNIAPSNLTEGLNYYAKKKGTNVRLW